MRSLSFREYIIGRRASFTETGRFIDDAKHDEQFLAVHSWADLKEYLASRSAPRAVDDVARQVWLNYLAARKARKRVGHKLTVEKVKQIKRKIKSGSTSVKAIARQYKISEMQLYRIKRGENWAEVKI